MTTIVYTKQQKDWNISLDSTFSENVIKLLVNFFGRTPYLKLNSLEDILFIITLHHYELSVVRDVSCEILVYIS